MEGSESEVVFESTDLNPQLFINEVFNLVDDLVDEAFEFFHSTLSMQLKTEGTDRSTELEKGIMSIRQSVQDVLDNRLSMWEKYCLRHCFSVPSGFALPTAKSSGSSAMVEGSLSDQQLDEELDSLRKKLAEVRKESTDLDRELEVIERQYGSSNRCAESVHEVLQFYEQNSMQDMFQEMTNTTAELKSKMEKLKNNAGMESNMRDRMNDTNGDISMLEHSKGLAKLDELMRL